MNWKGWLYSLVSAAIGGASSALGGAVVAPSVFNFTAAGWQKLGELALFGAAVPVFAYLQKSPLPPESQVTTVQNVQTSTTTVTPAPTSKYASDLPTDGQGRLKQNP
jgi:hypothetical protein